jgi:hypothetical protein
MNQFEQDKVRAEEARIGEILNSQFIPRLPLRCGHCRRRDDHQANKDFLCTLRCKDDSVLEVEVEGKNDYSTSPNIFVEMLGKADLDGLPDALKDVDLKVAPLGSDLHRMAFEVVKDRQANGLGQRDLWGLLLDDNLPARHWFFYRRKNKGYCSVYRTNRLVPILRPQMESFAVGFGPVQWTYYPYRSIGILVPEKMLREHTANVVQDWFDEAN